MMKLLSLLPLLATLASAKLFNINPGLTHNLAHLQEDFDHTPGELVTFEHPHFSGHQLEIKKHEKQWCDPDVQSYSGYINTGHGRNLFFTFFESRSSPKDDPVLMWINGGPGCSSMLGLFMELGPCSIEDPSNINGTKVNPHSWNTQTNLLFLEEPLGVGYSYGKHNLAVSTTEEAAIDVQAFLALFFETFKSFQGRELYLAGESYGGRYLPVFASAVVDGNRGMVKKGMAPLNLKGVLIGNGITDTYKMQEGYYNYQCLSVDGLEHSSPLQPINRCVTMKKALPYCQEMLKKECLDRHDKSTCAAALAFCGSQFSSSFFELGLNPYDVSKPCTIEELADGLCYGKITGGISKYLDLPEVRSFLGVSDRIGNFTSCSRTVGTAFHAALDGADFTWLYVAGLLERGVPVISYVGTFDWICNYMGNEAWLENLEWTGSEAYVAESLRPWEVDGKVAGHTKTHGGLTFATVTGAGHMVPYDKPAEALALLNRWIKGGGAAL